MNRHWKFATLLLVALAASAAYPQLVGQYFIGVGLSLMMWIALTQSWTVLSGMTGYISLGHAVFFGVGAYVMALGWGELPLTVNILLGGLAAGLVAFLVGTPCLRVRGPYFVILTFGLAEFIKFVVVSIEAGLGKAGRLLFATPSLTTLFYIMLGLAALAVILCYSVRRSRFGAGLRAIREDETAADTVGVPVTRFKMMAYVVSAIIPGMVGAVMMLRSTYFEPLQVFSPFVSFTIVTMAIIGGSDDAPGPLLGAIFFVTLQELLWANTPEIYMVIIGFLLVVFVLFVPEGIHGRLIQRRRRKPA